MVCFDILKLAYTLGTQMVSAFLDLKVVNFVVPGVYFLWLYSPNGAQVSLNKLLLLLQNIWEWHYFYSSTDLLWGWVIYIGLLTSICFVASPVEFGTCNSQYMLSPPAEIENQVSDSGSIKDGGFYLLKKDSERRSTLVKVMTDDEEEVYLRLQSVYNL